MRNITLNLIRGQVVKGLVKPIPVIKIKPITDSVPKFSSAAKGVEVNVVILERPPQPLYDNVILNSAPSVHADGY